jgi:hypothetical protein
MILSRARTTRRRQYAWFWIYARVKELAGWLKKGYDLDLGGTAAGYNFGTWLEGRMDYGAVVMLPTSARLSEEAGRSILTDKKTFSR